MVTTTDNVEKFAAVLPIFVGAFNATFKGYYFLLYRNQMENLMMNIQKLANERLYLFDLQLFESDLIVLIVLGITAGLSDKHFKMADNTSNALVATFRTAMVVCACAPMLGQPAYVVFHYLHGSLTSEKFKPPIPVM